MSARDDSLSTLSSSSVPSFVTATSRMTIGSVDVNQPPAQSPPSIQSSGALGSDASHIHKGVGGEKDDGRSPPPRPPTPPSEGVGGKVGRSKGNEQAAGGSGSFGGSFAVSDITNDGGIVTGIVTGTGTSTNTSTNISTSAIATSASVSANANASANTTLVHMKTEESNRCNLSIMLDHSHVLSRNRSLLRLVDSSTLSSAQGVPAIVSPKQGCLTGQAMLEVKKAGLGGVEMGPLKVKWLRAEVRGVETIRMKMEVQDEGECGRGGLKRGEGGDDERRNKKRNSFVGLRIAKGVRLRLRLRL